MARRPAPVDIGGIDKRRTGRDGAPGAPGSSTPGARGPQGRQGNPGNPGTPYWSATEPDPLEHPVWGNLTDDTIYYWYAGTGPWVEQGTLGYGVSDHEAAADPHPQYLTAAEGDAAYAPLAHVGSGGTAHATAIAGGAAGFMSGTDKTKLDGIAAGATANSTDATLLARANHTGTQLAATISDFAATVRATVLTGLSTASAAVVAATDTVLAAIGKLQAQLNAIASPITVGTYTPTTTGVANVASVSASTCFWRRVGDQVVVTGNLALSATAASTQTTVTISLPVASDIAVFSDCLGVGVGNFTSSLPAARIIGDTAGNAATFAVVPPTTASANYAFQFSYRVL